LRYLLMWERCLCAFVAVLENCGNHKKPPGTRQAVCLTLALEADTLFLLCRRLVASRVGQVRGHAGRLYFLC
jgi:hypothetical protein